MDIRWRSGKALSPLGLFDAGYFISRVSRRFSYLAFLGDDILWYGLDLYSQIKHLDDSDILAAVHEAEYFVLAMLKRHVYRRLKGALRCPA